MQSTQSVLRPLVAEFPSDSCFTMEKKQLFREALEGFPLEPVAQTFTGLFPTLELLNHCLYIRTMLTDNGGHTERGENFPLGLRIKPGI